MTVTSIGTPELFLGQKQLLEIDLPSLVQHPFWVLDWEAVEHSEVFWCGVLLFASGVLCSAAGIGGGGIYVMLLMNVGRLSPRDAVPLSKAVVFMGAAVTLVLNVSRMFFQPRKQGQDEAVLVDWNVCRLVVPTALLGTLLGVLLNAKAPDWVIVSMLTAVLAFMTVVVMRKGQEQYLKEVQALPSAGADAEMPEGEREPLLSAGADDTEAQAAPLPAASPTAQGAAERKPVVATKDHGTVEAQTKAVKHSDVVCSISVLLVVIVGGIVRYLALLCGKEMRGAPPDTVGYGCKDMVLQAIFSHQMETWMAYPASAKFVEGFAFGLPVWTCLGAATYFGRYVALQGGWELKTVLTFQVTGAAAGLLAGLVGIGGGLIFSPFFLLMGLDPASSVATSSTCVMFTSASTTFQYLFTYRIRMSLALVYGAANLVASYFGTLLVHRLQDMARPSYITFIVATSVAISALLSCVKLAEVLQAPEQ